MVDYFDYGLVVFFQCVCDVVEGVVELWFQGGFVEIEGDVIWQVQYDVVVLVLYVDVCIGGVLVQCGFLVVLVCINVGVSQCVDIGIDYCMLVVFGGVVVGQQVSSDIDGGVDQCIVVGMVLLFGWVVVLVVLYV